MPEPTPVRTAVTIPAEGDVEVAVNRDTDCMLEYTIECPAGTINDERPGERFRIGTKAQLVNQSPRLKVSGATYRVHDADWVVWLEFFQNGKSFAKTSGYKGQFNDQSAADEFLFLCKFK